MVVNIVQALEEIIILTAISNSKGENHETLTFAFFCYFKRFLIKFKREYKYAAVEALDTTLSSAVLVKRTEIKENCWHLNRFFHLWYVMKDIWYKIPASLWTKTD